jgi:hypothetical protein
MSWKPMVKTGSDPKWYGNALCFSTKGEAMQSASDLASRWMLVTAYDAHPSNDPVNYKFVDNVMSAVERVEV